VIAGLEIHSAATIPAPPPIEKCPTDYFDEAGLLHSQPAQQFGLKLVDAATSMFVSQWHVGRPHVGYPRVPHESLVSVPI
jgi:hypothetical protein